MKWTKEQIEAAVAGGAKNFAQLYRALTGKEDGKPGGSFAKEVRKTVPGIFGTPSVESLESLETVEQEEIVAEVAAIVAAPAPVAEKLTPPAPETPPAPVSPFRKTSRELRSMKPEARKAYLLEWRKARDDRKKTLWGTPPTCKCGSTRFRTLQKGNAWTCAACGKQIVKKAEVEGEKTEAPAAASANVLA